MVFIDGTVMTVALPVIQNTFRASIPQVQWVMESYLLFLAAFLILGGSSGDRFGRLRVYVTGVFLFAVASAWCGFAGSVHELIAARAMQGMGAALLVPGSLAILRTSFDDKHRGRAIGTWSAFTAIAAAIGPVLGGWLVEHVSWRWAFFINLPLAVIVLALALWRVSKSRGQQRRMALDWQGALLATVALGLLLFGLIEWSTRAWDNPLVFGTVLAGLALLGLFLFREARARAPMMPLRLFRSRRFSGANAITLLLYTALGGTLFFLPFNLIQVQGYTPTMAGAALLPLMLTMFLLSHWVGGLADRYGSKFPLLAGPLIAGLGFALFAYPGVGGTYWSTFFVPSCVLGVGMAVTVAPLTTTVMGAAGKNDAGAASGINNSISRVGALLAVALFGIILSHVFASHLDTRLSELGISHEIRESMKADTTKLAAITVPPGVPSLLKKQIRLAVSESYVAGFRWVMLTSTFLSVMSAVISWLTIAQKELK